MKRFLKLFLTGRNFLAGPVVVFLITGCVAPFPKEVRKGADRELRFAAYRDKPELYKGKTAVVAGEVIAARPLEECTEVEMLHRPMDWTWRPKNEGSAGRYIVVVDEFLDPAVWKQGRRVTFIAEITGSREGKIGERRYIYPVLKAIDRKLWAPLPDDYYHRRYYDPFRDPFYPRPLYPPWYYYPKTTYSGSRRSQ